MTDKHMILHKRNGQAIAEIYNYTDLVEEYSLTGIDEINFNIPHMIKDNRGKDVENYVYNLLDGDMLVEFNDKRYITMTPTETTIEGKAYKEVVAYSLEYELKRRVLVDFKGENRVIYDPSAKKDRNGVHYGLLNYIEEHTDWKVDYYNTQAIRRTATLDLHKTNALQAITDAQKTFQVVLIFDTMNKYVDIMDINQIGEDRNLYLSNDNFISELTKEVDDDNIITRLYCFGRDDLDIRRVNITGQPYIEDYSYYMNTEFMSEQLIKELKENQKIFEDYHDEYLDLYADLLRTEKKESGQLNGIRLQEGQLDQLYQNFDNNIENESERKKIQKQIDEKERTIGKMYDDLKVIQGIISRLEGELKVIAGKVNVENNLSSKSKLELHSFIKEGIYNNTDHGKYDLTKLYEEGQDMLQKVSRPQYKFTISLSEFNEYTGEEVKDQLYLGDIVHIDNTIIDEYFQVRLIGIEKSEDDMQLTFSSKESVYDEEVFLDDILAEAQKTSEMVDFSKFNWDKAREVDSDFRNYIQSELALANQGIVKAEGQKPILDDRGLWLYKEDKNGNPLPEQIRAVNNIIAITKDNWKNVEVAITPKGVMANQLIGDIILGTDLKVISNSGVVEILENLMTIRDDEGTPRVQIGQYERDKYGLKMTDKGGRNTVLDEGGILQVWQEGRTDNVDKKHGLKLHVYVPKNTREIYNAQLRYTLEGFRSYSDTTDTEEQIKDTTGGGGSVYTTTSSGGSSYTTTGDGGEILDTTSWDGGTYTTTSSGGSSYTTTGDGGEVVDTTGGGGSIYTTTSWDGSTYTTTGDGGDVLDTTGGGGGLNTTTFGGKDYDIDWVETWLKPHVDAQRGGQWFRMVTGHNHEIITDDHYHSIELPPHSHDVSIGSHEHSVSLDDHYHSIELPPHTHDVSIDSHEHDIKLDDHYHSIKVPSHTHSVEIKSHKHDIELEDHHHSITIPAHSHDISPIIKVYDNIPNKVEIFVNGRDRTYALTGGVYASGNKDDLDITKYLDIGRWNTIEIRPNGLGRVDATVFIQALVNFNYD